MSMRAVGDCRVARRWRGVACESLMLIGCPWLHMDCAMVACGCALVACPGARACARAAHYLRLVPRYYGTLVPCEYHPAGSATRQAPGWYHATGSGRPRLRRMSYAIKTDVTIAAGGTVLPYMRTETREELTMFASEIIRQYAVLGPTAVLILVGLLVFLTASAFAAK